MSRNQVDTGVGLTTGTTAGVSQPMGQGENLQSIDTGKSGETHRPTHGQKSPEDLAIADPAHIQPDEG